MPAATAEEVERSDELRDKVRILIRNTPGEHESQRRRAFANDAVATIEHALTGVSMFGGEGAATAPVEIAMVSLGGLLDKGRSFTGDNLRRWEQVTDYLVQVRQEARPNGDEPDEEPDEPVDEHEPWSQTTGVEADDEGDAKLIGFGDGDEGTHIKAAMEHRRERGPAADPQDPAANLADQQDDAVTGPDVAELQATVVELEQRVHELQVSLEAASSDGAIARNALSLMEDERETRLKLIADQTQRIEELEAELDEFDTQMGLRSEAEAEQEAAEADTRRAYATMLIERVAAQATPDPELLDRIDKILGV